MFSKQIKATSMCHCTECRKRSGSLFGLQARVLIRDTKIVGKYSSYSRISDEGISVTTNFCFNCGSTLFWKTSNNTTTYVIAAGMLGMQSIPRPSVSVYEDRLQEWFDIPSCIEEHIS